MNRHALIATSAITALSLVWVGRPPAADALFPQSDDSASADWTQAIPGLYLTGQPVYGVPTTLPSGVRWQPVVTRIFRGDTHFATFSSPDGRIFAVSENDGSTWIANGDYYDNTKWTLFVAGETVEDWWLLNAIAWIIIHLVEILVGLSFFVILVAIAVVYWLFGPGDRGRPRNQVELDILPGGSGTDYYWRTEPEFRKSILQFPGFAESLQNRGIITAVP